jgi:hypothetical protein
VRSAEHLGFDLVERLLARSGGAERDAEPRRRPRRQHELPGILQQTCDHEHLTAGLVPQNALGKLRDAHAVLLQRLYGKVSNGLRQREHARDFDRQHDRLDYLDTQVGDRAANRRHGARQAVERRAHQLQHARGNRDVALDDIRHGSRAGVGIGERVRQLDEGAGSGRQLVAGADQVAHFRTREQATQAASALDRRF